MADIAAQLVTASGANHDSRQQQKNMLDRKIWRTRQELRIAIVTWIERTYHRRRRQDTLGRLTPIEYENIVPTLAAQAA